MSNSAAKTPTKKIRLRVRTSDDATEVFIINSKLDLVAQGTGPVFETELESGIYKVKARGGSQVEEKLVTLPEGKGVVVIKFKPLNFASPAPIKNTAKTHKYHMYAAERVSQPQYTTFMTGRGSSIFLFSRFWTGSELHSAQIYRKNKTSPMSGLSLHAENGQKLLDIEEFSFKNFIRDPWASCLIETDPGLYRLRLELADGMEIEQTIVATHNWQTQVFLLQRDYGKTGMTDYRADLSGAAIVMNQGKKGFSVQESRKLRTDELARLALAGGRQVITKDLLNQLLDGKFKNPMFGIFGAHLLLMEKDFDARLLETVVTNLRRLVGTEHPDVEALGLLINDRENSKYIFRTPPMLRRSWAVVVNQTIRQPQLVPPDSLSDEISTRLWGNEPLLLWINKNSSDVRDEKVRNVTNPYQAILREQLKPETNSQSLFEYFQTEDNPKREHLSHFNHMINRDMQIEHKLKDRKSIVSKMVETLGLPQSKIEKMIDLELNSLS